MNRYPMMFVHGYNGWGSGEGLNGLLPYWGATTGDLMKRLILKGYDCYSASVGPVSSAWDRACELYAQLCGTTVDYGEAHSRKSGHKRFGRTYQKPLFEGWSESKKVHLIGHSFGGTTVRLLTHLLTNGCQDEIDASGEDVSPLFTGGKEHLTASITTICTPHNSSSIYKMVKSFKLYEFMFLITALYCGTLGRTRINGNLVDFHLEQFGLTNTPGKKDADGYMRSIMRFLKNNSDTCEHDLLPESTEELNNIIRISPDVYYFSYAFNSMTDSKLPMAIFGSNPVIAPLGFWMAHQKQ
ncbi:MAG: lipase, partial [Clostridia bacterium]|nr:lipase [Clostridia bacterium]